MAMSITVCRIGAQVNRGRRYNMIIIIIISVDRTHDRRGEGTTTKVAQEGTEESRNSVPRGLFSTGSRVFGVTCGYLRLV